MGDPAKRSEQLSTSAAPELTDVQAEALLSAAPHRDLRLSEAPRLNSTYFGLLAEFGEAHIPLEKVAPKYFGKSYAQARREANAKTLACRAFRVGGQKSPWLVSAIDLAELIDRQRSKRW